MARKKAPVRVSMWRPGLVFVVIIALFTVGGWKTWKLQIQDSEQLQREGSARTVRDDVIAAQRGYILDRHGEPLAISTPVTSLVVNPQDAVQHMDQWAELAPLLEDAGIDSVALRSRIETGAAEGRQFIYVRRRMAPLEAERVLSSDFPGLTGKEEYRRFYPLGEVAAHVVGLTNADEMGQEGMELAWESWLQSEEGSRRVMKDLHGRIISELGIDAEARPGNDLYLSIDSRLQYLSYRALKEAVTRHRATSGSAVVLDVKTGEVLALVNQPSYNPNNRESINTTTMRNQAIVDQLEPGSTVKPFTIIAALESGLFDLDSAIDTSPGTVRVDDVLIKDPADYGVLSLERIITKSSQVGASKLALAMSEQPMLDVLTRVGFGQPAGTAFPGESQGLIPAHARWSKTEIATLGYGYGFTVTPLQLAQAYLVIASGGYLKPVSLLKGEEDFVQGVQIIDAGLVSRVVPMMETVVSEEHGGTGVLAGLPAWRVAGKTGTARVYDVAQGAYDNNNHTSLFAGFLPASDPEVVIVVTIHRPQGEDYGGGRVAAPAFGAIAEGVMRILNVAPDKLELEHIDLSANSNAASRVGAL